MKNEPKTFLYKIFQTKILDLQNKLAWTSPTSSWHLQLQKLVVIGGR